MDWTPYDANTSEALLLSSTNKLFTSKQHGVQVPSTLTKHLIQEITTISCYTSESLIGA